MTTTDTGRTAEQAAADYLQAHGYAIQARNWRTRWCEIDIVATKNDAVYCIEVKYRATGKWGDGLDAITPRKLRQMAFAAQLYMARQHLVQYCLAVAAVSGYSFDTIQYVVCDG